MCYALSIAYKVYPERGIMHAISKPSEAATDRTERAQRAVTAFRKMQHGLTAYARAVTGSQRVRVEVTHLHPHTDGKTIYYRPPIALGDKTPHDRALCDERGDDGLKSCLACRVREEVLVNIYHEIAHIAFGTFAGDANLMRKAGALNPYGPHLLNALEDARVDGSMFQARAGVRKMLGADTMNILRNGFDNPAGENVKHRDMPLNSQMCIATYLEAAGYQGWREFLHEKVGEDISDPAIQGTLGAVSKATSANEVYNLTTDALARLRELGYFKTPEEEQQDEEEESQPEPQDDEQADDDGQADADASDVGPDTGGGEPEEDDEPGDPSDNTGDEGAEDSDLADGEGSSDAGEPDDGGSDAGEADGEDGGRESSVPPGNGARPEDAEASAEPGDAGGSDEADQAESNGEEDGPVDGADQNEVPGDSDSQADGEGSVGDGGTEEESGGEGGDQSDSTDASGDGNGGDADQGDEGPDGGGSSESGEGLGDGDADQDADSVGEGGLGDAQLDDSEGPGLDGSRSYEAAPDGEPVESDDASEGDEGRSGEPDEGAVEETDQPGLIESGADQGEGGVEVDEVSYGTPEDVEAALSSLHGEVEPSEDELASDAGAVSVAVIQGQYFETPSTEVTLVTEYQYDVNGPAWAVPARIKGSAEEYGIVCDMEIPETVIGPALLRTRRIFSDNKNSSYQPNLRSGRVNAKVLGKRAWSDDDRLFGKKRVPSKKDYAVLIMMDISSSNFGDNLALLKRSVYAQAELMSRVGIDFSIVAHSAQGIAVDDEVKLELQLHHVKDWSEPWSESIKERVRTLSAHGGNLDGHAMEYGRKLLAQRGETDKIMLYYTDGKMPAANHDEELVILERQIKLCRRDNVTLLGVGVRTDSPVRHGLDTVQVDDDEDLKTVVQHLGKRLTGAAR